jgi:hypothetical protein
MVPLSGPYTAKIHYHHSLQRVYGYRFVVLLIKLKPSRVRTCIIHRTLALHLRLIKMMTFAPTLCEHMTHRRRQRSAQLPCMPGCHRNTNSVRKLSIFGNCASGGNARGHRHTHIATPSSAHGLVFRWHPSYTLLRRLRWLI